jgi:hypothetical protein
VRGAALRLTLWVTTNSTGNLSTTVTATVDGYWCRVYAGTSALSATQTGIDFMDPV